MSKELRDQLGVKEDRPNDWFETLYSDTSESGEGVPWANMTPHPLFKKWVDDVHPDGKGKKALVVGCGLGDDAIELEKCGFDVTAFDVSKSAIELCKKRFPNSGVDFVVADLIKGENNWHRKFDLVLEIFTIQALPPKYEMTLIQHVSDFVANSGELIVITEIRNEKRNYENGPPWLLNPDYVSSFEKKGLQNTSLLKSLDTEMGEEIHLAIFKR